MHARETTRDSSWMQWTCLIEASCADVLRASSRVPSTHMDRGELRDESLRGRLVWWMQFIKRSIILRKANRTLIFAAVNKAAIFSNCTLKGKGAFHLSELTGQTLLAVTRISLLIKTIQPDQSNPKYYARNRWFFSKNSWEKPISLLK